MITRLQEQGYNTALRLGSRAFQYVTNVVMQTAIKVNKNPSGLRTPISPLSLAPLLHIDTFKLYY
jgi:hypothetical protein